MWVLRVLQILLELQNLSLLLALIMSNEKWKGRVCVGGGGDSERTFQVLLGGYA